jgi:hypothetical protein
LARSGETAADSAGAFAVIGWRLAAGISTLKA